MLGLLMAVLIGVSLVAKEVERRSLYLILSKPVHRHEVILGKYAGLVLTLAINLTVMVVAVFCILGYMSLIEGEELQRGWEAPAADPAMLKAFFLIFMQLMIITAVALFFSTFSSPILSAILTFGLYVVGHFNADLRAFETVIDSRVAVSVAKSLYYILPNFSPFNVTAEVVHAQPVTMEYIVLATAYALAYIAILLMVSMFIFSRRDFT